MRSAKRNPNASLVSFDKKNRTLIYRIGFGNLPLQFNGFVFYLNEKCDV